MIMVFALLHNMSHPGLRPPPHQNTKPGSPISPIGISNGRVDIGAHRYVDFYSILTAYRPLSSHLAETHRNNLPPRVWRYLLQLPRIIEPRDQRDYRGDLSAYAFALVVSRVTRLYYLLCYPEHSPSFLSLLASYPSIHLTALTPDIVFFHRSTSNLYMSDKTLEVTDNTVDSTTMEAHERKSPPHSTSHC